MACWAVENDARVMRLTVTATNDYQKDELFQHDYCTVDLYNYIETWGYKIYSDIFI